MSKHLHLSREFDLRVHLLFNLGLLLFLRLSFLNFLPGVKFPDSQALEYELVIVRIFEGYRRNSTSMASAWIHQTCMVAL
jgi:hypothetical protein